MKLRITRTDGAQVGYQEAILRYLPEALMNVAMSIGVILALLHLSDAEYFSASSLAERQKLINAAAPTWNRFLTIGLQIWIWSEFLVMLTNKKRQAIHDFIAGTVVILDTPSTVGRISEA